MDHYILLLMLSHIAVKRSQNDQVRGLHGSVQMQHSKAAHFRLEILTSKQIQFLAEGSKLEKDQPSYQQD